MSYLIKSAILRRVHHALRLAAVGAVATACASLPLGHPRNHLDSHGLRHGYWQEYFDAAEKQVADRGHYRHGRPVGQWRYYAPNQQLERKEQFRRFPAHQLVITYYHPNGQVAKRGHAQYELWADGARFFWFGEWTKYSETGQALPSEYYVNGLLQEKK